MILCPGCPANGAPSFESLLIGTDSRSEVQEFVLLRDRLEKPLQEATDPLKEDEKLQGQRSTRKGTLLA